MGTGGGPEEPPIEVDADISEIALYMMLTAPCIFSSNMQDTKIIEQEEFTFKDNTEEIVVNEEMEHPEIVTNTYTNGKNKNAHFWSPCELFNPDLCKSAYVVMVLNRPIPSEMPRNFIINLWNKALLRVTVDGGTNHWLSWLKLNNYEQNQNSAPDIVTGDMDSVSTDVLDYFYKKNKNLKVIKTPDQNETDFTKALRQVKTYSITNNIKIDTIYVLIDSSGRFDQILANVQTLFKAQSIIPNVNVVLVGGDSLTWLLMGKMVHSIQVPPELIEKQSWCALIPIGRPCTVTTTGLKWNLKNALLEFGKIVSTSNTYCGEPFVTVESDNAIVWSMAINELL